LRRAGVGDFGEDLVGAVPHHDPGRSCQLEDHGMPGCGGPGGEQLPDGARSPGPGVPGDRLTDGRRALGEERPGAQTRRAPGQPPGRPYPLAAGVGQHSWDQAAVPSPVAGTFARAVSTSDANAPASLTASSASMRRSTSIPAALSPWMNRL
jgi:hypothetical protein